MSFAPGGKLRAVRDHRRAGQGATEEMYPRPSHELLRKKRWWSTPGRQFSELARYLTVIADRATVQNVTLRRHQ